jgi:integrase
MSTYASGHHNSGHTTDAVTHSKDDALDDREFELLLEGAASMRDYYGIQAQFCILVLGRLGLRRGELAHMKSSWVDNRRQMIEIPLQQDCHSGKDGGICGYCRQLAEQRVDHADDLEIDEASTWQWRAKTPAAAREVFWGFDARVELYIQRFFDRFDQWEWSAQALNRRVNKAAEKAPELDPEDVYPHALRATAASELGGRGMKMQALMQHFGWAKPQTADVYLARNAKNTARQLQSMQSI